MKRNNKKGFTIVELVIVIAVIAILSAVLIPTFGSVINDANETARDQEAKNALNSYIANNATDSELATGVNGYIVIDGYFYNVVNNNIENIKAAQNTTKPEGTYRVVYCNTAHAAGSTCAKCGTVTTATQP